MGMQTFVSSQYCFSCGLLVANDDCAVLCEVEVDMRWVSMKSRIRSFSTFGTCRRVRTTSRRIGRMACQGRSILGFSSLSW